VLNKKDELTSWIETAAWPFRNRLGSAWESALQEIREEVSRLLPQDGAADENALKADVWRAVSRGCLDRCRAGALQPGEEGSPASAREDPALLLRGREPVSEGGRRLWRMILDGLSCREIGERLGVSEEEVRVRVRRCREEVGAVRRPAGLGEGEGNDR
jgi:DNA-binding CsgD family transcriptional regulator